MLQTPISQIHNIYICYARLNIYIAALVIINNYIHINTIHHRTTQFECVRLDHTAQTVPTGCQESDVCVCATHGLTHLFARKTDKAHTHSQVSQNAHTCHIHHHRVGIIRIFLPRFSFLGFGRSRSYMRWIFFVVVVPALTLLFLNYTNVPRKEPEYI